MKLCTFEEEDFWLLGVTPDWNAPVNTEFEVPGYSERSADGSESMRKLADALRLKRYSFQTWAEGEEASLIREGLKSRGEERLLVPFWPGMQPTAEFQLGPISAGMYVTFEEDAESGEMVLASALIHRGKSPGVDYNLTTQTRTAALVPCEFANGIPELALPSDEMVEFRLELVENSEAGDALVFAQVEAIAGPLRANGEGAEVFPLTANWESDPTIVREQAREGEVIGQGRRQEISYHGDQGRDRFRFIAEGCDLAEVAGALAFFEEVVGNEFWVPDLMAAGLLSERQAGDAGNQLRADAGLEVGEKIALLESGDSVIPLTVTEVDDDLVTTDGFFPDLQVTSTVLARLVLARFAGTALSVVWDTDSTATLTIEAVAVSDDEDATTGGQETVVSLYEFRKVNGELLERLTSFEKEVVWDGESFAAGPITHGSIEAGLELDDSTSVEGDWRVRTLREFFQGGLVRAKLVIRRVELATGQLLRTFHGELSKPRLDGRTLSASVTLLTRDLDARLPRVRFQRPCNWALFNEGCGLDEADWTWMAEVTAVNGREVTLSNLTRLQGAEREVGEDFFSYGYVLAPEGKRCLVVASTGAVDGVLGLSVGGGSLCPKLEVGVTVTLVAGCDGRKTTCQDKFVNFENFGGHEVAEGNLSLVKVSADVGGGKK